MLKWPESVLHGVAFLNFISNVVILSVLGLSDGLSVAGSLVRRQAEVK